MAMRTDPSRHPIDEEIESIFEANPGLREELLEAVREIERGEADPCPPRGGRPDDGPSHERLLLSRQRSARMLWSGRPPTFQGL